MEALEESAAGTIEEEDADNGGVSEDNNVVMEDKVATSQPATAISTLCAYHRQKTFETQFAVSLRGRIRQHELIA